MRMLQGQCISQGVCSSTYPLCVFQLPPVDEAGYDRGMLSPDCLDFAKICLLPPSCCCLPPQVLLWAHREP